jgi:hypothetical protein
MPSTNTVAKPKPVNTKPPKTERDALKASVTALDTKKALKASDLKFIDDAADRSEIVRGWIEKCRAFKKAK